MTNDESSPRDNVHLEDKDGRGDQRDPSQPHPQQPSMLKNLLITATVAAIFGGLVATGYSHFFGSKSGEPSSSQSKTEAGSSQDSSPKTMSDGGPNTDAASASSSQASTSSPIPVSNSAKEADELKKQIHGPQATKSIGSANRLTGFTSCSAWRCPSCSGSPRRAKNSQKTGTSRLEGSEPVHVS